MVFIVGCTSGTICADGDGGCEPQEDEPFRCGTEYNMGATSSFDSSTQGDCQGNTIGYQELPHVIEFFNMIQHDVHFSLFVDDILVKEVDAYASFDSGEPTQIRFSSHFPKGKMLRVVVDPTIEQKSGWSLADPAPTEVLEWELPLYGLRSFHLSFKYDGNTLSSSQDFTSEPIVVTFHNGDNPKVTFVASVDNKRVAFAEVDTNKEFTFVIPAGVETLYTTIVYPTFPTREGLVVDAFPVDKVIDLTSVNMETMDLRFYGRYDFFIFASGGDVQDACAEGEEGTRQYKEKTGWKEVMCTAPNPEMECLEGQKMVTSFNGAGWIPRQCVDIAEDAGNECTSSDQCTYACVATRTKLNELGCGEAYCAGENVCEGIVGTCEDIPHEGGIDITKEDTVNFFCPH